MSVNCTKNAKDFTKIVKYTVVNGDSKLTLCWQTNGGQVVFIDSHADWRNWSLEISAQHFSHLEETWKRIRVDLYRVNTDELNRRKWTELEW